MENREPIIVLLLSTLYGIAFSWRLPFLQVHTVMDWTYFSTMDQWAAPTAPLYGASQWGLESRFFSPWHLLDLLCGPTVGMNLLLPIHLAIAFGGGWVLARVLGLGWRAAFTCAVVYPSSSWLYLHFAVGHLSYLPFCYVPWTVAALWRNSALGLAASMALAFFGGGVYMMLKTGFLLGIVAIALTWRQWSLRPASTLLVAALLTLVLVTPKLVQIWPVQSRADPHAGDHLAVLSEYASALFSGNQTVYGVPWDDQGGSMGFQEAGAYLSPLLVPLIVAGAGATVWTVAAAMMLMQGMGDYFGPWSPWRLVNKLPLMSSMRISPRWFILLIFCSGVMAAHGVERLSQTRIGMIVAMMLLAGGLVDCWIVSTMCLGLMK